MGADYAQTVDAFKEAEAYNGTSIIMCYSPCIDWGIDMSKMMEIQKMAVDSGYWPLYRWNPANEAKQENPFSLDSKRIKASLASYLQGENRYAALRRADNARADLLQGQFEDSTKKRMQSMQRRAMDDVELLDVLKAAVGEQTGEKGAPAALQTPSISHTPDLGRAHLASCLPPPTSRHPPPASCLLPLPLTSNAAFRSPRAVRFGDWQHRRPRQEPRCERKRRLGCPTPTHLALGQLPTFPMLVPWRVG